MLNRVHIDAGGNYVRAQQAGDIVMDQIQATPLTTVGAGNILASSILAGCVERTGPTGAFTDTLDTADNLIAAVPGLTVGDSFQFLYRNTVAFAQTLAVGLGGVLSGANTAVAASSARMYLVTILSSARLAIMSATSTNASPTLTGFTAAQIAALQPGMGVSGTGIPANTSVIAVNANNGTVTLSANATASGLAAMTFTPQYTVKGMWSASL